jgi:hypothetical protein
MIRISIYSLTLFGYLLSIDFTLQNYSATINIDNTVLEHPFTGGNNYPRISWYDWDNDGDSDLFMLDEDLHFRYFRNDGTSIDSQFILTPNPINTLSGMRWFHLDDFNNDGSIDLATQSTVEPTHVMYFIYNGTAFEYVSTLVQDNGSPVLSASVMTPTFVDIDNDNDLDFFTGNVNGTVNYYENYGFENGAPIFEFISSYWQEILIVGPSQQRHGASAIRFIDLDGDEDLDLAWGDYFQRSLYIIWNIGTVDNPDMDQDNFVYQFPVEDPIYTSGQNMPSFVDLDGDDDMDLYITVLGGDGPVQLNNNFLMYENVGSSTNPIYEYKTDNFLNSLDLLSDVAPEFVDIDNDTNLDFFVGQDYTTETSPTMGRLYYFNNEGLFHPTWTLNDSAFLGEEIGLSLSPKFIDIDDDYDQDLFIGDYNGKIRFYRNNGTLENQNFNDEGYLDGIDLGFFSIPEFVDIDNDGDYDMFIGSYSGGIYYFENTGNSIDPIFIESTFSIEGLSDINRTAPRFIDLDKDNDYDLVIGTANSGLLIYWNIGDQSNYNFSKDECIDIPFYGNNIKPWIGDINNSQTLDLIIGISTGGFLHYLVSWMGDVNSDNNLDILDLIIIVDHITSQSSEFISICGIDMNHDDVLDISDIILLLNIIIG